MTDEYYKGQGGWHNLRFVIDMANLKRGGWDDELVRIIRDGTVKLYPGLMQAIKHPDVKLRVIEAIMLRKIEA